jgi:hypothetical protein
MGQNGTFFELFKEDKLVWLIKIWFTYGRKGGKKAYFIRNYQVSTSVDIYWPYLGKI